jgi:hypothetical protein
LKDNKIIESISKRGNGEIYLGVVGAVRTGKSTFIKKVIENLVVPNITDEYEKKHCLDEIPQSAQGKTIMTTEPKFVPSNGATIKIDEFTTNIKLIDCVGYVIPESNGYEDENGNPCANCDIDINIDLIDIIEKRISDGVNTYFKALTAALKDERAEDIQTIHLLLAGNSSKSPVLKKIINELIDILYLQDIFLFFVVIKYK